MPTAKLDRRFAATVQPTDRTVIYRDADLAGFCLRVTAGGAKTWIVDYRPGGGRDAPKRQVRIGSAESGAADSLPAERARQRAKDVLAGARLGDDLAARRAEERKAITVADTVDRYLAEHVKPKRAPGTFEQYDHLLRAHLVAAHGAKRLRDVTSADVDRLHLKLKATPYAANRLIAVTGAMWGWAARQGLVPREGNPARGAEKFKEDRRERFLTPEEFGALGDAIRVGETVGFAYEVDESKPKAKHAPKPENRRTKLEPEVAAAIRLLILTGARLREILHLRWAEVDEGRGLLLLSKSKTGRKAIVLNAPALAVLAGLDRTEEHVIRGVNGLPRADLKKPWAAVCRAAGLEGLRIHDLRHSFASVGAGDGMGLPVIGKLLGHSQAATTQRYAHLDASPLRRAADAIGARISRDMGDADG